MSGSCGLLGEIRSSRRILPWRTAVSLAAMTPRCLSDLRGLGIIRGPASGCPASNPSGKVPDTHSVGSICDHDFGVFTVTNIATENTGAVPPAHPVPRMPKAANHGLRRCRGPRVPLTCLAPLAAWQSLCTGHVDASLENSVALAFTGGDSPSVGSRYFSQPCVGALASLVRQRGQLVNRRKRFAVGQDLGTLGAHYENVHWRVSGKENSIALDHAYTGRFRTVPTVDYVDGDSLALRQARDPRALQRRSMHKDILAAPI